MNARAETAERTAHPDRFAERHLGPSADETAAMLATLGLDSLDVVEFVARLEYRFRFVVPDDQWQQLATLDAIAAYALGHLPG